MSYQFIHIEDYSINVSKKKKNDGSEKYKKETKGRSVSQVISEAKREDGFCSHVEKPEDPKILYGVELDEVERLAIEYHENTKTVDKNGKEKKLRSDANILLAGVVSLSKENSDIWNEYKKDTIKYLKNKYGDCLKSVIEHTDEENPHLHFYVIQKSGLKFDLIHDGKRALHENKDKKKHDQNIEYLDAMRKFQSDFFESVSSKHGLTKDGPRRQRLNRSDYFKQVREIKTLDQVKLNAIKKGKQIGYSKSIKDFREMSWFNQITTSISFNINMLERDNSKLKKENTDIKNKNRILFSRNEHNKKEKEKIDSELIFIKEKYKETESELSSLKRRFSIRIKKITEKLHLENSYLLSENEKLGKDIENIKKENDSLKNENNELKSFVLKIKNHYGEKFKEWLDNIMKRKNKHTI